ncbi:MAG: macro domain-containing protein [Chloroflexi bacterium]|nr:macro domain-containing protein [Chloroflexota bacterium]
MKIVLADVQGALVVAWRTALADVENVEIHHGSIFDARCDALVSPANSFGFMDGGLDLRISEFFGWQVEKRLQKIIQEKHHGELLVGLAEIVSTDHPQIPFVISAPTMRVPMILRESVNVYLATRAILLLIKFGQFEDGTLIGDKVKTVAIPGMGTGVGKVLPEVCARQMKQAIDDINGQHRFPLTWSEAQRRHQLMYSETYRDLQH